MTQNILPQNPISASSKKAKNSTVAILFIIILVIILIILGERFMMDLNHWFNTAQTIQSSTYDSIHPGSDMGFPGFLSTNSYETYRLLIHAAFAVPVFLAGILLYFWFRYRKPSGQKNIILWPYFIFSIWVILRIIGETFYVLITKQETLGLYIALVVLAAILTWLVIFTQKKWCEKHLVQIPIPPQT